MSIDVSHKKLVSNIQNDQCSQTHRRLVVQEKAGLQWVKIDSCSGRIFTGCTDDGNNALIALWDEQNKMVWESPILKGNARYVETRFSEQSDEYIAIIVEFCFSGDSDGCIKRRLFVFNKLGSLITKIKLCFFKDHDIRIINQEIIESYMNSQGMTVHVYPLNSQDPTKTLVHRFSQPVSLFDMVTKTAYSCDKNKETGYLSLKKIKQFKNKEKANEESEYRYPTDIYQLNPKSVICGRHKRMARIDCVLDGDSGQMNIIQPQLENEKKHLPSINRKVPMEVTIGNTTFFGHTDCNVVLTHNTNKSETERTAVVVRTKEKSVKELICHAEGQADIVEITVGDTTFFGYNDGNIVLAYNNKTKSAATAVLDKCNGGLKELKTREHILVCTQIDKKKVHIYFFDISEIKGNALTLIKVVTLVREHNHSFSNAEIHYVNGKIIVKIKEELFVLDYSEKSDKDCIQDGEWSVHAFESDDETDFSDGDEEIKVFRTGASPILPEDSLPFDNDEDSTDPTSPDNLSFILSSLRSKGIMQGDSLDDEPLTVTGKNYQLLTTENEKGVLASLQFWNAAFAKLPYDQFFRMYIDYDRQLQGAEVFDSKEPNYRYAMLQGFAFVACTLGIEFDSTKYIRLHDTCVQQVKDEDGEFFDLGISNYGMYKFPISSKEAVQELQDDKVLFLPGTSKGKPEEYLSTCVSLPVYSDDKGIVEYIIVVNSCYKISDKKEYVKKIKEILDSLFKNFYASMKNAKNKDEKLITIAKLLIALSLFHIFNDGNQRTISNALLNKFLIENGFSPCILKEPNCFDGQYTIKEIVSKMKEGITTYRLVVLTFGK